VSQKVNAILSGKGCGCKFGVISVLLYIILYIDHKIARICARFTAAALLGLNIL
jgi:hypothetical protein